MPDRIIRADTLELQIIRDESPSNLRDDDNLSVIFTWERDYCSPDRPGKDQLEFEEYLDQHRADFPVLIPLRRLYEGELHETTDESRTIGYLYVDAEKIEYEYDAVTEESIARATKVALAELKIYNQFVTGDVWGYRLCERTPCTYSDGVGHYPREIVGYHGDRTPITEEKLCLVCNGTGFVLTKELDAVWGFYGDDPEENGIFDNLGKEIADKLRAAMKEQHA